MPYNAHTSARDGAGLALLRDKLAAQRSSAPLFDTRAFVRGLEAAFDQMWQIHAAGRPPARIAL